MTNIPGVENERNLRKRYNDTRQGPSSRTINVDIEIEWNEDNIIIHIGL